MSDDTERKSAPTDQPSRSPFHNSGKSVEQLADEALRETLREHDYAPLRKSWRHTTTSRGCR